MADLQDIAWQFNEAVSLLREARLRLSTSTSLTLIQEIDEALPTIQSALEAAAAGREVT